VKKIVVALALMACAAHADVLGRNVPAQSLTAARIAQLPAKERPAWNAYLQRSEAQMAADKAVLAKEREGLKEIPPLPLQGFSARAIPLNRDAAWYATDEARHRADIVLSFQTPAGGWSKNLRYDAPRQRGQMYATANLAPVASAPGDFDEPRDPKWHYVGTLDNDATNTELHFLAKVATANPAHAEPYQKAILRGVNYLLKAQYANGGWPQVWPLEGGYHDAVTFNDDAVVESAQVLLDVANGHAQNENTAPEDYSFVPAELRTRARAAASRALDCMLRAQIRVPATDAGEPGIDAGTVLTVWAQQYDPLTLEPSSARNYEMPALSSGESASVMKYLMDLPQPSPAVERSIDAAAAWFQAHKIVGYAWTGGRNTPGGHRLVASPGAGPLWPRYVSLTTGKPIFGDRDKTIHTDVMEISDERRNGYAWYGTAPADALAQYEVWFLAHREKVQTK
jgi:PelA/Pel-15E family pectate lyase